MSFYQPRHKPAPGGAVVRQPSGNAKSPGAAPARLPVTPQFLAQLRKAKPVEGLLPSTYQWFEDLPGKVRPVALVTKFARIANVIARDWNDYDACCAYFDDLLTDRRGNRQGFPADVYRDLLILLDHYQRMRISQGDGLSDA